jgi:hypothetical protein
VASVPALDGRLPPGQHPREAAVDEAVDHGRVPIAARVNLERRAREVALRWDLERIRIEVLAGFVLGDLVGVPVRRIADGEAARCVRAQRPALRQRRLRARVVAVVVRLQVAANAAGDD